MKKDSSSLDIEELKAQLRIDQYALDLEIVRQPELFQKVSEAYVEAESIRDAAYETLKQIDAELNLELRREAERSNRKATDSNISSAVAVHDDHVLAHRDFLDAKRRANELEVLKDSFSQRSYMLRDLVQLHIAGYFMDSSLSSTRAKVEPSQPRRQATRFTSRKSGEE